MKEQIMIEFCQKAGETGVHVKQMESYAPCQNTAEGMIQELKM